MLLLSLLLLTAGSAGADDSDVQTIWRLLDYVAVDYSGAVSDGRVVSEAEYDEMIEFAGKIEEKLKDLADKNQKNELVRGADMLRAAITAKASATTVAQQAKTLASALLNAYPVPLAPSAPPDLSRAKLLYADNCAACHGLNGDGKGPNAGALKPPPTAFTDSSRASRRSIFGLYQVISLGLDGTAMASWGSLPSADRWALAFYVGTFAYPPSLVPEGEKAWRGDTRARAKIANMESLVATTSEALAADIGPEEAKALISYLRRHPEAVGHSRAEGTLALSRSRLDASLKAYATGDQKAAAKLALSAYLDGFEPVEPALAARDRALMSHIEREIGNLRASIDKKRPLAELQEAHGTVVALLKEAESTLESDNAGDASTFLAAFGVLLRERIEALLVVVAMVAFLRKTERVAELRYVHGGWIAALIAGLVTWFAATYLVDISGASRELTEGFGSLLAAVILVTVGIWMHGKSSAERWQQYIRDSMARALSRSGWFLFLLAFIVVYREAFETILFYVALWAQGNAAAMLAGAGAAAFVLALIAWVMLRYSAKLPITQFFFWSSALIAMLAVVLAGKGVAALQEGGVLGIDPVVGLPRVQALGLFPTVETVLAQVIAILVLLGGFWINRRSSSRSLP